jgi:nitrite reductase/ring-hydroxylating ferredoxin subunit
MPKTVRLYEHSPALDIQGEKGIVTTAHGKIQADHIIMATGTPKGVFPVQLLLTPLREFALAVQVHDHAMPPGIFWGVGQEELSLRLLTIDAATSYLILIGEAHKTGHSPPHSDPLGALHHYLAARFKISASGQGWSAQSYMAADNLPYIGHSKGRIFYMTGFSTDGLVYGTLAAMVVSDQILGNKNPWSTRYQVARCSLFKSAPAVVKEGLDICSHYLKNVLPSASTSLQEIAPGDGAIVQIKGERLAVYRKDASTYQCVSAVCTHLKCVVVFNPLEKTWDCPCHASRFATDGTVIEGPALKNLEIREG